MTDIDIQSAPCEEHFRCVRRMSRKKQVCLEDHTEHIKFYENVTIIEKEKSFEERQFIEASLNRLYFFSQISDDNKALLIEKMFYCKNTDEWIFKEGQQSSLIFVLDTGSCERITQGIQTEVLQKGACFGLFDLLQHDARSISMHALEDCCFWVLDKHTFKMITQEVRIAEFEENLRLIEEHPFFEFLSEAHLESIARVCFSEIYKIGQRICIDTDNANKFFIVKEGQIAVYRNNKEQGKLTNNSQFGWHAMVGNKNYGSTLVAFSGQVEILPIQRYTLERILGKSIKQVSNEHIVRSAMVRHEQLKKLTNEQTSTVIKSMKFREIQKGGVVKVQGETNQKIIVVIEGSIAKASYPSVPVAKQGTAIQLENPDEMSEGLVMYDSGVVAEIGQDDFYCAIGGPINSVLERNHSIHELKYIKRSTSMEAEPYREVQIEDMQLMKELGEGQFAKAQLVKSKTNGKYFCLKVIPQSLIKQLDMMEQIQEERKVHSTLDHPFIVKYIACVPKQDNMYFVQEFINGVELFDAIRTKGLLKPDEVKFYAASLVLCLEYLHNINIVYRDLKPENVMIDHQGFVKLIDFGTSKRLKKDSCRTFTLTGTPGYMAPEILEDKGYGFAADLWSLGALLFECLCGPTPFGDSLDDPYEIYEEIKKKDVAFPKFVKDENLKSFISQLLHRNPEKRLGGSFEQLKSHAWLAGFDWNALIDKKMQPAYVPAQNLLFQECLPK